MGKVFLLQRLPNGHCDTDTEKIRNSIDFLKWKDPDAGVAYEVAIDVRAGLAGIHAVYGDSWTVIPVGSLEFINEVLAREYGHEPVKAINIPEELQRTEWLGRRIAPNVCLSKDLLGSMRGNYLFIKPAQYEKEFDAFTTTAMRVRADAENYEGTRVFVSEPFPAPVAAEWRIFVYRGRVVDIRPYDLGEWVFPDKTVVASMVKAYKNAPPAYTLDVAVLATGQTVVVEVHNFVGCGLYGFQSLQVLPVMLASAWQYEISR